MATASRANADDDDDDDDNDDDDDDEEEEEEEEEGDSPVTTIPFAARFCFARPTDFDLHRL